MADPLVILVAEPHDADRERIVAAVKRVADDKSAEVKVYQATTGNEARDAVDEEEPHLVISEVLLPHFNGLQLVRELRRDRKPTDPPTFFFVTHMNSEFDRYWGLRNGAHAYVMKPFEDAVLEQRLSRFFAGSYSSGRGELGIDEA